MATIPSSNFTSAQVIEEASGGTIRAFSSNDADVRKLAGKTSGSYSSADWAGKSASVFPPVWPLVNWVPEEELYFSDIRLIFAGNGNGEIRAETRSYGNTSYVKYKSYIMFSGSYSANDYMFMVVNNDWAVNEVGIARNTWVECVSMSNAKYISLSVGASSVRVEIDLKHKSTGEITKGFIKFQLEIL